MRAHASKGSNSTAPQRGRSGANRAFTHSAQDGASAARAIARSSYAGEVGKFLLSVAGFAVVFALVRPIDGLAVFAGYLAMLAIQITGSWLLLAGSR